MDRHIYRLILLLIWLSSFVQGCNPSHDPLEDMALIPAGEFQMGTKDAVAEEREFTHDIIYMSAWFDEQPAHTVHVDAFYMDIYPVTNKQYREFLLANPIWQKENIDPKYHDGNYLRDWKGNNYPRWKGNHPVTSISWYAAMAYATWSGKRLPTEAEWERAARGGLKNKSFPWGNTIDSSKANYDKNIGKTTPVGKYAPNQYGLYDMVGNVMEMVLDEYDAFYYSISSSVNPVSGADTIQEIVENYKNIKTHRGVRGGSWANFAPYVRVADRNYSSPKSTGELGGFRCVKDVPDIAKNSQDIIKFVSANPPNGSTIKPNDIITLTFNDTPEDITVTPNTTPFSNSIATIPHKKTVTILGIFTPGELNLQLNWKHGSNFLAYKVETPVPDNMVLIPTGAFKMGHLNAKNKLDNNVNIDAFYIDKYEVTVGEYKQFVNETGHRTPDWKKIAEFAPTDKHPMIFVNWFDAMLYARWVGKRLPTAAEWEKAARGGLVEKKYPWGDTEPDGTQANFAGTTDGYEHTAPVGSFLPNGYGLHDIVGNVLEWCLDSIHLDTDSNGAYKNEDFNKKIIDITTNFSKIRSARGVRGGSWSSGSYQLSGSYGADIPATNNAYLGFRCIRPVEP